MPDLRTLIALYEADLATRPADRPINVIRVTMLRTTAWRQDAGHLHGKLIHLGADSSKEYRACESLAEIGEVLGLDRVGRVVERSRE